MKTRAELLAMADALLTDAAKHAEYALEWNELDAARVTAISTTAKACVMLAKELREGEAQATFTTSMNEEMMRYVDEHSPNEED